MHDSVAVIADVSHLVAGINVELHNTSLVDVKINACVMLAKVNVENEVRNETGKRVIKSVDDVAVNDLLSISNLVETVAIYEILVETVTVVEMVVAAEPDDV